MDLTDTELDNLTEPTDEEFTKALEVICRKAGFTQVIMYIPDGEEGTVYGMAMGTDSAAEWLDNAMAFDNTVPVPIGDDDDLDDDDGDDDTDYYDEKDIYDYDHDNGV